MLEVDFSDVLGLACTQRSRLLCRIFSTAFATGTDACVPVVLEGSLLDCVPASIRDTSRRTRSPEISLITLATGGSEIPLGLGDSETTLPLGNAAWVPVSTGLPRTVTEEGSIRTVRPDLDKGVVCADLKIPLAADPKDALRDRRGHPPQTRRVISEIFSSRASRALSSSVMSLSASCHFSFSVSSSKGSEAET